MSKKKHQKVILSDGLMMTRDSLVISEEDYFKKAAAYFGPATVKEIFKLIYDIKMYDPMNRPEGFTREQYLGARFDTWFDAIFADVDEDLMYGTMESREKKE